MQRELRILLAVFLGLLLTGGALIALGLTILANTPDYSLLKSKVKIDTLLPNGTKGSRWVGPHTKNWVTLPQISNNLITAVIASEDTSFYSHVGYDPHEIVEAIKKDLKERKFARGASTLTQQVVKNVYLERSKTIWRKAKEILWARQLEKVLTKGEILTFYLNLAEWGPGIYGIGEASQHYFGIRPLAITAKQAAFLALLLPSPIRYYAYFENKELSPWARKRIQKILRVMNRMHFLDSVGLEEAIAEPLWSTELEIVEDPLLDIEGLPQEDPENLEYDGSFEFTP